MSFTSAPTLSANWRDVSLAAAGRAVSYCGDYLAATTLALTLQSNGDHGTGVAALLIAAALPLAVFGTLAGRLADRIDSRRLVVITALGQAAICAVLAVTGTPAVMVVLVAVLATGSALTQPAFSALTPEMVPPDRLARATAVLQTAGTVGMLVGPAAGGLLVGAFGSRLPLLLDAASFVFLAGVGLAIRTRRGGHQPLTTPEQKPTAPWRLWSDPVLRTLVISVAVVIAAVTATNVAEVFFIRTTLGSTPAMYGLVMAAWTAGMVVGVWPFSRLRGADHRIARTGTILLLVASLILLTAASVGSAAALIPLYFLGGGANAGLNVVVGVLAARRVPAAVRGRAGGTINAVAATANLTGYLAGGALLAAVDPRMLIAGSALLGLAAATAFLVPAVWSSYRRAAVPAPVD